MSYCEQSSGQGWRKYYRMLEKKSGSRKSSRATIASVKKEMGQPRLTESVRNSYEKEQSARAAPRKSR
jgi:hypothetical protein